MKLSWVKTHWLIKKLFSNYIWDIPNNENKVYLTFDDGPTPEITNWTFTLENQELPPLPAFPDLTQIPEEPLPQPEVPLPYIEVPVLKKNNLDNNI